MQVSLASVGVSDPGWSLAAWHLVDNGEVSGLLEDPDAISLVDNLSLKEWLAAEVLNHIVVSTTALVNGGLICSRASITGVSTKSDADLATAVVRVDFVVPTVGVGLPVLRVVIAVVVDAVEAEIVSAALEVVLLVDTAALIGGTLGVNLVQDTADITHGSVHVIFVIGVGVDEHVLHGVIALLSGTTASNSGVRAQLLGVKLLSSLVKGGILTHLVLELHGGCERSDSRDGSKRFHLVFVY